MTPSDLTLEQAAAFLGIRSQHTVESWLKGGDFPGAYRTEDGEWRFPVVNVKEAQYNMQVLEEANRLRLNLVVEN